MAQPESKLSREIQVALRVRGIWCFKVHGGPFTKAGTPDIIACVPIQADPPPMPPVGLFVGFETKMPAGGDPSPVQEHQHLMIRQAYGHVFVPRSVQDALEGLESIGWVDPRKPGR